MGDTPAPRLKLHPKAIFSTRTRTAHLVDDHKSDAVSVGNGLVSKHELLHRLGWADHEHPR